VVVRLHAAADLDAALVVLRKVRSQTEEAGSVAFTIAIAPPPDGGVVKVEIDRFDTLVGWHFHHTVRLSAGVGTIRFSRSNSGYSTVLVAPPVAGE
jgi:hypothetical protein